MANSPSGTLGAGATFGPYSIVRQVGRGAFGIVYEAVRSPLKKRVALKILHEHVLATPDAVTRFQREIMAAAQVEHPHVIQVFDGGMLDERGYLAMEFLEGETLAERLKREGPMEPDEIVDVMLPIASALDAVHNAGVVHRDIKPGNIFLARHVTGAAYPKLVDFGIAKLLSDDLDLTQTHSWLGTPFYMSPEQVRQSKHVDARSDQWSLAVVLYEALTGEKPFQAEVLLDLLEAITARTPKAPSEVRNSVPRGLDTVIARMMERDVPKRFPSMRAAGTALWPFASPAVRALWARHFDREGDPLSRVPDVIEARLSEAPGESSMQKTTVHDGVSTDAPTLYAKVAVDAPKPRAHTAEGGPAQTAVHPTWRHMATGAVLGMAAMFGGQHLFGTTAPEREPSIPAAQPAETSPEVPAAPPVAEPPVTPPVAPPTAHDAAMPAHDASTTTTAHDASTTANAPRDASAPTIARPAANVAAPAATAPRGAPYCDGDASVREPCEALARGDRAAALSGFLALRSGRALVGAAHLYRQSGRIVECEERLLQAMANGDAWTASHTGFTNALLGDVQGRLGSIEVSCASGAIEVGGRHYPLPRAASIRSVAGHVQVILSANGNSLQQYVDVRVGQTARITTCPAGS